MGNHCDDFWSVPNLGHLLCCTWLGWHRSEVSMLVAHVHYSELPCLDTGQKITMRTNGLTVNLFSCEPVCNYASCCSTSQVITATPLLICNMKNNPCPGQLELPQLQRRQLTMMQVLCLSAILPMWMNSYTPDVDEQPKTTCKSS